MTIFNATTVTFHDVVAGFCAVALTIAVICLAILGRPVPDVLSGVLGAAVSWVFRGALDGATSARSSK